MSYLTSLSFSVATTGDSVPMILFIWALKSSSASRFEMLSISISISVSDKSEPLWRFICINVLCVAVVFAVVKRVVLFISNAVEIRVVLTPIAVFGSLGESPFIVVIGRRHFRLIVWFVL
jgi:hypothetical protein